MHFTNFFTTAIALALGTAAVRTENAIDGSPMLSKHTARYFQAASDLQNVSTYHALTRVRRATGHSHNGVSRRQLLPSYHLSPTTSFANGQAFYTPVKFGSQTFNLLIDTGSADTWVITEDAQCINSTGGLTSDCSFLGPRWNQSDCIPVPDENFNIPYGGNNVDQGTFCTIDVTLAGITASNQQVAAVNVVRFGGDTPTSGLLGLGYPSLTFGYHGTDVSADNHGTNQAPYDPVFTTMYRQNKISPVFSIALSRASTYRTNDGYIALGGLAPVITYGSWAVAPMEYVSLTGGGFYLPTTLPYQQYQWYTITPNAFLYQSSSKILCNPAQWIPLPAPDSSLPSNVGNGQYILDSGSTQVYLPTIMAAAIAAQFNPPAIFDASIGQYAVPCTAKAPWFAIKIGGVVFAVDKRDMIIDDGTGTGNCAAGTNDGGTDNAPYTLGDVFMNNVLTVFDVGSGEMKFRSRGLY